MTPYTKQIVELHKIHKAIENCGCNKDDEQGGGDSGNLLMSLIPSNYPKPDLFLFSRHPDDPNSVDVTNYKIDDFLNLYSQQEEELSIQCLYKSSNLSAPIVIRIAFGIDSETYFAIASISDGTVKTNGIPYNNNVYYYYFKDFS